MRDSVEDVVSVAAKISALNRYSTCQCVVRVGVPIYMLTSSVRAIPLRLVDLPQVPLHWLALQ